MTGRFSVEYSPEEDDWSSVCGADVALVEKGRILACKEHRVWDCVTAELAFDYRAPTSRVQK